MVYNSSLHFARRLEPSLFSCFGRLNRRLAETHRWLMANHFDKMA